jgi:hypothetical protein
MILLSASSRTAAVQAQKIAAPSINDRFSRGIAAITGCIPKPKGGLCKVRFLRLADLQDLSAVSTALIGCCQP